MKCGYDPESFWDQTSRSLTLAFEARAELNEIEHDQRMSLAWHIAALVRWPYPQKGRPVRPFPKLDKLLIGKRPRTPQTPEQMLQIAKMLTVAFGGTIVNRRKDR